MAIFVYKTPTHLAFDVEFTLVKGVIFTEIVLANGAILKLWAAHPYLKFGREPPSPEDNLLLDENLFYD